jgi:hypothetical protein
MQEHTPAGIVQPPQGVDAKVIADNPEARAQQESGDDEPSLFEVHRASAVTGGRAAAQLDLGDVAGLVGVEAGL